jgi:3-hydroxyisobutyryl-CoA hydrolase
MSTRSAAEIFKEQPGDEPDDVVFNSLFGLRSIELNRPQKLNSLNGSMIRKIVPRLLEWQKSDMANLILLKGAGEKALCAGGDVAALALANQKGPEGQQWSTDYFALEYMLDHLIATYDKPYIALMDGITMGGGVGLSVHAPIRIATERTLFAMPETTIGFFPDVGASFFLPRMPGATGTYLALTSERLRGVNVFYSGIATHYLHSTSLPSLESRLSELRFKDFDSMDKKLGVISATIDEFSTGLPHDEPILLAGELRKAIDRCFLHENVDDILAALAEEQKSGPSEEIRAWAAKTLKTLHERSPTAVHVTLRQMQIGRKWSISETFSREHQIAAKFMRHTDFTEGVSALLINKPRTTPNWRPASLEDISPKDNISEPFFKPSKDVKPLQLLTDVDYTEYPYRHLALPTEGDVEKIVLEGTMSRRELIKHFITKSEGKVGVNVIVGEILDRKTTTGNDGKLVWQY